MQPSRRSRHRQAGFFILFGWRTRIAQEQCEPVQTRCPGCRRRTTLHGMVARPWFTLFFVPVLPLSGGERFSQCQACGGQFRVDIDTLRRRGEAPDPEEYQHAISLFNQMRDTPNDPVRLHAMMSAYCSIDEFGEAVSNARQFPAALAASEACMVLMAYACQETGDRDEARYWCDQALAANPASSDARQLQQRLAKTADR